MATPNILSKEARQFITENCSMSGEELRIIVKEEYGVDVSVQAILEHVKKARKNAEEKTRLADACISHTIAERVNQFAPTILSRYEKEMDRIASILDGSNNEFVLDIGDNGTRDKYWHEKYVRLYNEISKNYLSLRPPIQTIRVESAIDPDVAAIDSWTDEQIEAFEEFKKTLTKKEEN